MYFRFVVWTEKDVYNGALRNDKQKLAEALIVKISQLKPPGRFVELVQGGSIEEGECVLVEQDRAIEKTCQALREKKNGCPMSYRPSLFKLHAKHKQMARTNKGQDDIFSSAVSFVEDLLKDKKCNEAPAAVLSKIQATKKATRVHKTAKTTKVKMSKAPQPIKIDMGTLRNIKAPRSTTISPTKKRDSCHASQSDDSDWCDSSEARQVAAKKLKMSSRSAKVENIAAAPTKSTTWEATTSKTTRKEENGTLEAASAAVSVHATETLIQSLIDKALDTQLQQASWAAIDTAMVSDDHLCPPHV
jgi:hypothetical protein